MAGSDLLKTLRSAGRRLKSWRWQLYQDRLLRSGWYDPAARCDAEAVLIGGCPRSGTTLLREILGRHSRLSIGPETSMLVPGFDPARIAEFWQLDRAVLKRRIAASSNLVDFAGAFYKDLVDREGTRRWVDKASANVRNISQLLAWFPRATFVHVIRDGRDACCSLRTHPTQVLKNGVVRERRVSRPIGACASAWLYETTFGLAFRGHPRYHEVRYEELVTEPEKVIRTLCDAVGETFEPALLTLGGGLTGEGQPARLLCNSNAAGAISSSRVGRWRADLALDERRQLADAAGELLVALGYTDDRRWVHDEHP